MMRCADPSRRVEPCDGRVARGKVDRGAHGPFVNCDSEHGLAFRHCEWGTRCELLFPHLEIR